MPFKRTARKPAHEPGAPVPDEQAEPTAVQPGPEPDGEQAVETGRPYRDVVEAEARKYWQEISNPGSLVKPTKRDLDETETLALLYDAINSAIARNDCAAAEVAAMQSRPGADISGAVQTERPYQAFVESEARKYWQKTSQAGSLVKPAQEEIRAAALPVLCVALRNRAGNRRHQAVADMVQHARDKGWIKRPYSRAHASASYIDALIQLADDANLVAREIPLPDHPLPHHPPIYYTIESYNGRPVPVPRKDAIIRGHYLYNIATRQRLTDEEYIYPVLFPPDGVPERAWPATSAPINQVDPIDIHGFMREHSCPVYYGLTFERARKPLNQRGVNVWFDSIRRFGDGTYVYSDQLRDYPHPSFLVFSPHPPKDSLQ